ncbi:hypothetical protein JCM11641_007626 [Rhodosporidiobolus odoratus]
MSLASPPPSQVTSATPQQPLTTLLERHISTLTALYTSLSPSPSSLINTHLTSLRTQLETILASQLTTAQAEVFTAEQKLAASWKRVHDWQAALGEPLRSERHKGDGPLLSLCDEVDALKEGMKGRMEERGKRMLLLNARVGELREVVGSEFVMVSVEEAGKGWEEMDLRLERMGDLEREVMRCEAEIARRKDLISTDCGEVFTLRTELGIHQPADPSQVETSADPLDEEVLWHVGVGEARQPRREIVPTKENVERVAAKRKWLEDEKASRNVSIQTTYDKLYPLWTMLGVTEDEMEEFVNRWMGSTMDVVNAYQAELARMLALKRTNLATFICRERALLSTLWDTLYLSHPQRLAQFPAYSISVEPTRVWNAAHGCEEEVVSDNVSEELLVAHERERERIEGEVEEARPVLERLRRYFEVVEKGRELEVAAADPSRLMDKSRGAAMRLAQEAKDRKRVDREKPKLEAELRTLIPQWEAQNNRPFLVNGVSFIEGLDEQKRQEEMEKENRKRAKLGLSASTSHTSSARPLRAQHTGGSSLSSTSASQSIAPLKRQMTGASIRSTTSSASSTAAPPAKRPATASTAMISRPRSRSVLGDAQLATPASGSASTPSTAMKPQITGQRNRSGTIGSSSAARSSVPPTPATTGGTAAGVEGTGMRIPVGWGAATPCPAPSAATVGGGGMRQVVPQATGGGGFRPGR